MSLISLLTLHSFCAEREKNPRTCLERTAGTGAGTYRTRNPGARLTDAPVYAIPRGRRVAGDFHAGDIAIRTPLGHTSGERLETNLNN